MGHTLMLRQVNVRNYTTTSCKYFFNDQIYWRRLKKKIDLDRISLLEAWFVDKKCNWERLKREKLFWEVKIEDIRIVESNSQWRELAVCLFRDVVLNGRNKKRKYICISFECFKSYVRVNFSRIYFIYFLYNVCEIFFKSYILKYCKDVIFSPLCSKVKLLFFNFYKITRY